MLGAYGSVMSAWAGAPEAGSMRVARHKTTFLGWLGVWLVVGLVGSSSLLHWDRAWMRLDARKKARVTNK